MALSQTSVLKLYHTVIDDVIAGVRDSFLDEGIDEQVLQEMKQIWTKKLLESKAVETSIEQDTQSPVLTGNTTKSKSNGTKAKKPSSAQKNEQKNAEANAQQQATANNDAANENNGKASQPTHVIQMPNKPPPALVPTQPQMPVPMPAPMIIDQKPPPALIRQTAPVQPQQHQQTSPPPTNQPAPSGGAVAMDPNKKVPIQITLPALPNGEPRVLEIQVPAIALQENRLHNVLTQTNIIQSVMSLPPTVARTILQQHINAAMRTAIGPNVQQQVDGMDDTSDDEVSDMSDDKSDNDDDDDDNLVENEEEEEGIGAEEEPLCSDDDVSEEENQNDLFDTDNVVVCLYDKITRSRNKWKFYLKDGIMNIGGKDYIFQKSNGDAEW